MERSISIGIFFGIWKYGFGDFNGEFWIGLLKLHKMTNEKRYELYIHLVDQNNEQRYARYDNFTIGSEDTNFKLISLGTHTGNTRDSMRDSPRENHLQHLIRIMITILTVIVP